MSTSDKFLLILLTKYPDPVSRAMRRVYRWNYSHASIGLTDGDGKFFSIVTKGFRIEDPQAHPTMRGHEVPCVLYRLPVSNAVYEAVRHALQDHVAQSSLYRYSFFGLFLCVLRISFRARNRYFCSQFVAEVLDRAAALTLEKPSTLYVPDDFAYVEGADLVFHGTLKNLVTTPALFAG